MGKRRPGQAHSPQKDGDHPPPPPPSGKAVFVKSSSGDFLQSLSGEMLLRSKIAELEKQSKTAAQKPRKAGSASKSGGSSRGGSTAACGEKDELSRQFDQLCLDAPGCGEEQAAQRSADAPGGDLQAARELYLEQARAMQAASRQVDVLTRKCEHLEATNEVTRTETERCTNECRRLKAATEKLGALSKELHARHWELVEQRKNAAELEAQKRQETNAALNTVIKEMSAKLDAQDGQRVAQDEDKRRLREELQARIAEYEEVEKKHSEAQALHDAKAAELEARRARLARQLEEEGAKAQAFEQEVATLAGSEADLRAELNTYAVRFEELQAGLEVDNKRFAELRPQLTDHTRTQQRLEKERRDLQAGTGPDARAKVADLQAAVAKGRERAETLAREKEALQTRCRELQAERKALTDRLAAAVAARAGQAGPAIADSDKPQEVPTA